MKVIVKLKGLEDMEVSGEIDKVISEVDKVLERWKVVWNGEKKGKGC